MALDPIRGPGGSLWGSNAVNGIINVITKKASDTQGSLVSTEFGSDVRADTAYRYGGKLGSDSFYRVYAKYLQRGSLDDPTGIGIYDNTLSGKFGFRIDAGKETGDKYVLLGDLQSEHLTQATGDDPGLLSYSVTEFDGVGRWERNRPDGASQRLQISVDHTARISGVAPDLYEKRDTFDADYQLGLAPWRRHSFTFGAGVRHTDDSIVATGEFDSLSPPTAAQNLYSVFLHDTIEFRPMWKLLVGSKFENNPYTGWAAEPNAQLLFTPSAHRTYWASISRAVTTPSRLLEGQRSIVSQDGTAANPTELLLLGNPNVQPQSVIAYEAGTRFSLKNDAWLDVAAFFNDYQSLLTLEPGTPQVVGNLTIFPEMYGNELSGQTAGVETAVKVRPSRWWNLSASCSLMSMRMRLGPTSESTAGEYSGFHGPGSTAGTMFQIHSNIDLPAHFEFDCDLYYTSSLVSGDVPAYYKLDLRLGWNWSNSTEFSFGIRNALGPSHIEGVTPVTPTESVPRSVYLKATFRF